MADRKAAEKAKAAAEKAKADAEKARDESINATDKARSSLTESRAKLKGISEDLQKAEIGRKAAQDKTAKAKTEAEQRWTRDTRIRGRRRRGI